MITSKYKKFINKDEFNVYNSKANLSKKTSKFTLTGFFV